MIHFLYKYRRLAISYAIFFVLFMLLFSLLRTYGKKTEKEFARYRLEKEGKVSMELGYLPIDWNEKGTRNLLKRGVTVDLKNLQKDYLTNFNLLNKSIEKGDQKLYTGLFLDSIYKAEESFLTNGAELGTRRSVSILDVKPMVNAFVNHRKFLSITDTITELVEYYKEDAWSQSQVQRNVYKMVLIMDEGVWHFRHLSKEQTSKVDYYVKSNYKDSILRDKEGKPIDLKGINYYPQKTPWFDFYEKWNPNVIKKDAAIMQEAGLNVVRIFFPYRQGGAGTVREDYLYKLCETVKILDDHGLKVILTLFDFVGDFDSGQWMSHKYHLKRVADYMRGNSAILAYDIKNEPDLDFKNFRKSHILNWLKFISTELRKTDPNTLQTIGWSQPQEAEQLMDFVDFVSFHYYEKPEDFITKTSSLRAAAKNKPLVISEFGKPSISNKWMFFQNGEKVQANYYKQMFNAFSKANLEHFLSWTLYDFDEVPEEVAGASAKIRKQQSRFGFIDTQGKKKKAYQYISGIKEKKQNR